MDMAESDTTTIFKNNKNGITCCVEKEHMFDKVVTPSDVGKLNRLVIPKQHAEKFFPLDSGGGDKALLLNFEDRNGKSWRFRYSYWTSSQSYVMTKGWSRFVKDKKLDAGDIVSFERGIGDLGRGRLFIDSRRRPDPTLISARNFPFFVNQYPPVLPGWGLYSSSSLQHPETMSFLRPLQYPELISTNFGGNHGAPPPSPNLPAAAATKSLRLFGVNMMEADSNSSSSSSNHNLDDHRRPAEISSSDIRKGKSSTSSLDLDL